MRIQKLDRSKLKKSKNIAKLYYEFKNSVEAFENGFGERVTPEALLNYQLNKSYMEAIEDTFNHSINSSIREMVWEYFFNNIKPKDYEEKQIKNEIERWLYYLSKEIGIEIK